MTKIPTWRLFTLTAMEKSKAEKSPWVKKKKKTCCNAMLFPGNRDLLSQTLGDPVVPLDCGFVRRDNLRAWRELFTNLYKLKSRF